MKTRISPLLATLKRLGLIALAVGLIDPLLANTTPPWYALKDPTPGAINSGKAPGPVFLIMLLTDGSVWANSNETCYRLTPDSQGSYVNGRWTTLQSMHDARTFYASAVLRDGRLFVAGGEYGASGKAEVFDPQANNGTGNWTSVPVPAGLLTPGGSGIYDAPSKILPDGKVMVAPPFGTVINYGTLIFDPISNTISAGPPLHAGQDEASWVKLPDDSILTIDSGTTTTERYLPPPMDTWKQDKPVPIAIYDALATEMGPAILLPNGKAFFMGNTGHTALYTPSGNTSQGSWEIGPDIPSPLKDDKGQGPGGVPDAPAAMMMNGKILCTFSRASYDGTAFPAGTYFYEYDYADNSAGTKGRFSATPIDGPNGPGAAGTPPGPSLGDLTSNYCMLNLPDGSILFANRGSDQLYLYKPTGAPQSAWKPTISGISANGDGSYHLTGTQLNGISEGAAYGDDMQMSTNFPIVRLTFGSNVYYARTYNWSSTGVQTGSRVVSTDFILPTVVANGGNVVYSLSVVANGIASDPVSFPGPVWVDFNYTGATQAGSFVFPYKTLAQGVTAVVSGGAIWLKAPRTSAETFTSPPISKPLTIVSIGGSATVGH